MNGKDLSSLEQTLQDHPWFTLGHLEMFKRACEMGEEQVSACLSRTAAHVWSRENLFYLSTGTEKMKESADQKEKDEVFGREEAADEILFEIEKDPLLPKVAGKIVLAGGDYFSRAEMDDLELDTSKPVDKFISEKPSLLRTNVAGGGKEEGSPEVTDISELFEDPGFYTETLARIYSEQGFYKRAIEVYAKLILLYPEKSSYFATLVQELKSKYNN